MSRRKKILLGSLAFLLAIVVVTSPWAIPAGILAWAKYSAKRVCGKYPPDVLACRNALPAAVTLPPSTSQPLGTIDCPDESGTRFYTFKFPPPRSLELTGRLSKTLVLTYAQFKIHFFLPFSTAGLDALMLAAFHETTASHDVTVDHARPLDIDSQPDIASLKRLLKLITEKPSAFALATYFAEFNQRDRRGWLGAMDKDMHQLYGVIYFPSSQSACYLMVINDAGVNPKEALEFLASLQISPKSPASTTSRPFPP